MQLSIIIPCYNEVGTLARLLRSVREGPVQDVEIIVVDDGSTDGSRELLAGELAGVADKVLLHETNRGKGAALRTGLGAAEGDYVVVQDADLEYSPAEFPRLLEPLLAGRTEVVFGSRFAGGRPRRAGYRWHFLANRFLTLLSNCFTGLRLTDMETCYKMFRRELIQGIEIEEDRFGFEPEITAKVARLGCAVCEVGISYRGRTFAENKKIGWRDGVRAVYAIFKYSALRDRLAPALGWLRPVRRAEARSRTPRLAKGAAEAGPMTCAGATPDRAG